MSDGQLFLFWCLWDSHFFLLPSINRANINWFCNTKPVKHFCHKPCIDNLTLEVNSPTLWFSLRNLTCLQKWVETSWLVLGKWGVCGCEVILGRMGLLRVRAVGMWASQAAARQGPWACCIISSPVKAMAMPSILSINLVRAVAMWASWASTLWGPWPCEHPEQ